MSDSLRPHGLYSPWNSPGQNTGVGNPSLLQEIFPTQGLNKVSRIAGGFCTSQATREAQKSIFFAKSWPLPINVNKVLLAHKLPHLCTECICSCANGSVE